MAVYPVDTRRAAVVLYERGYSLAEVASVVGCSKFTVRAWLLAAGAALRSEGTRRGPRIDRRTRRRAAAVYRKHRALRPAARELGVSYDWLRLHLLAAGVPLRRPGRPRGGEA